jgi:putative ABC transport system permease protein
MLNTLYEVRRAIRSLRQQPAFTVTTLLVLAVGVGVTTAALSVLNVYLLRPIPIPEPDRLLAIVTPPPNEGAPPANLNTFDWKRALDGVFDRVVMWDLDAFTVVGDPHPEIVLGAWVSPDYFAAGGVRPILGRALTAEDSKPGAPRVALISHRVWQSRFGGDPGITGRAIKTYASDRPLEANVFTIVGVLPPDFWFFSARFTDVLAPLADGPRLPTFVRLRDGVTVADAGAAVAAAMAGLSPVDARWRLRLESAADRHVAQIRPTLVATAVAVALVLFVALANVAMLLLLRALDREREVSIRIALGAGRARLARQLLTETIVLSVLGSGLGLALAGVALDVLGPAIQQQLRTEIPGGPGALGVDWMVFSVVALVSVVIGALLGVVPLVATRETRVTPDLQGGRTVTMTVGRRRLRSSLVALELAVSFALIVGAALTIQSALYLNRLPLGFTPDGLLKADVMLSIRTYPQPADRASVVERLVMAVAGVPGVESATAVWPFPFRGAGTIRWDASTTTGVQPIEAAEYVVGAQYFETLRIPLQRGRLFTIMDNLARQRVAIVSDEFARRAWPGRDPLGERVRRPVTAQQPNTPWMTVVGVVGETRETLTDTDQPELYLPHPQRPLAGTSVLIRSSHEAMPMLPSLRAAVSRVDPELALFEAAPLTQLIAGSTSTQRFLAWLLGALAVFASLLAVVGVYGVIAFSLARRQRDIAMRLCLGAKREAIVRLLLRQEGVMVGVGLVAGLGLAVVLGRAIASELHGIQQLDPTTFATAVIGFALVALVAIAVPAVRTARLDIMTVFRRE